VRFNRVTPLILSAISIQFPHKILKISAKCQTLFPQTPFWALTDITAKYNRSWHISFDLGKD